MTPQIVQFLVTAHLSLIVLLLVLFVSANIFYQTGRNKFALGLHYTLRGAYLPGLISGGLLIGLTPDFPAIFLKAASGLLTLIFMEIHLNHIIGNEHRPRFAFLTYFMIVFTIVLGVVFPVGISVME
ncbi:DUF1516 family protein [Marinococcus luteus]|uniref:DUF1516 family protein n=1 Tax=Marinococcus luteus TaxID=1122204 RepID=UPI00350E3EA8